MTSDLYALCLAGQLEFAGLIQRPSLARYDPEEERKLEAEAQARLAAEVASQGQPEALVGIPERVPVSRKPPRPFRKARPGVVSLTEAALQPLGVF